MWHIWDRMEMYTALVRPRHRWEDNIKMDVKEIGLEDVDYVRQDRDKWRALVNTVLNIRVALNAGGYRD
jgi:hypothetical protein